MNRQKLNKYGLELLWASLAIAVAVAVILIGDNLLGVQLEIFQGMSTFNALWILDLILVPLVAGIIVSFIYGLGGKIIAHFPPLIAKCYVFYNLTPEMVPAGAEILPIGFWILIVIVAVEAGAAGGLVGEILIKKTYGRSPKHLLHKRYSQKSIKS